MHRPVRAVTTPSACAMPDRRSVKAEDYEVSAAVDGDWDGRRAPVNRGLGNTHAIAAVRGTPPANANGKQAVNTESGSALLVWMLWCLRKPTVVGWQRSPSWRTDAAPASRVVCRIMPRIRQVQLARWRRSSPQQSSWRAQQETSQRRHSNKA